MDHDYFVYIVSNNTRSTLYIGVTNDLERRIAEHRSGEIPGFAQRYHFEHARESATLSRGRSSSKVGDGRRRTR